MLLSIPFVGNIKTKQLFDKKYDYLIVTKPHIICPKSKTIADYIIYWCHSEKDTMYSDRKSLSWFRKINRLRLQYVYRRYDRVWFLTDEIEKEISKAFGLKNTCTLPNPIDCETIIQKSKEEILDFKITHKYNIALVGRLSEEKGFDRVIRAMKDLKEKDDWHLYIIGDVPHKDSIIETIKINNMISKVTLLGTKENPYKYIRQMQLLVCPSYMESFGLVMLEAMLLKVPIIATNTAGGRYVTKNGLCGKLIDNSDSALKKEMVYFLNNPNIHEELIEVGYKRAMEHDVSAFKHSLLNYLTNKN